MGKIKIITLDGPSGVGKGTLCKMLANYYNFHMLDSGALYRISALHVLNNALDCDDENAILQALANIQISFEPPAIYLNGVDVSEKIREEKISQQASKIAKLPKIRDYLVKIMHSFAKSPGLVADGRDMGTVVFPQADLKIFLTASAELRAKRRFNQLIGNGKSANMQEVFSDLLERDQRDMARHHSPLEPALEAIVIDTDKLDVLAVFEIIKQSASINGISPPFI